MPSIGLCLIAKDEAGVIVRCIESARPLIDFVLVVDTGSTDNTPEVVTAYLKQNNLAGEIIREPWRDFAYNRTHALRCLRRHQAIDYSLMLDADQTLVYDEGFSAERFKKKLRHDIYDLCLRTGPVEFFVPNLASNRLEIIYKAVLHEYREVPNGCSRRTAKGFRIEELLGGARSRNPSKYKDDAEFLEALLRKESDPFLIARYTFYLAQSYREYGDNEKALASYMNRTKLGFWSEEVFISYLYAARLQTALARPGNEIIETFLAAHKVCPWRAEAFHGVAQLCRVQGNHHLGYLFAESGLRLPAPISGILVERWIYEYGLLDELAVLAYWTGRYRECLNATARILKENKLPESERSRVRQNAEFAERRLAEQEPALSRAGSAELGRR